MNKFLMVLLQAKWIGVLHHVLDEHEWLDGACEHEPLSEPPTDVNGVVLKYFSRDEPAFRALQKLIMDRNWLKSLKYYTRFRYIVLWLH